MGAAIDFHGQVGTSRPRPGLDWLFDHRAAGRRLEHLRHDKERLKNLLDLCQTTAPPTPSARWTKLRISGSPYYLLTRFYEETKSDSVTLDRPRAAPELGQEASLSSAGGGGAAPPTSARSGHKSRVKVEQAVGIAQGTPGGELVIEEKD